MRSSWFRLALLVLACAPMVGAYGADEVRKVVWQSVREKGLVATYLRPKGADILPTILVLGGSEGSLKSTEWTAYKFAERGWAALAVAYFGEPGLPPKLANIPLEYIDGAVQWLGQQPLTKPDEMAIIGVSRGSELALLVAAHNPAVNRVIAVVPSHVSWGPVGNFPDKTIPAWTRGGKPVPFISPSREHNYAVEPYYGTPDFLVDLRQTEKVAAATIPLEKIHGAVLLLSGDDDQIWPSAMMARLIIRRLAEANHPFRHEHVSFPGAGHLIMPGFDPGLTEGRHPNGMLIAFGGNKRANQAAQRESLDLMLEFLRSGTQPPQSPAAQ